MLKAPIHRYLTQEDWEEFKEEERKVAIQNYKALWKRSKGPIWGFKIARAQWYYHGKWCRFPIAKLVAKDGQKWVIKTIKRLQSMRRMHSKEIVSPELTLKYHISIICEGSLGVFNIKYRVIQVNENMSFKKLIEYKCTCLLWQECLGEGGILILPEDYPDDDDPDVDEDEEPQITISFTHLHAW